VPLRGSHPSPFFGLVRISQPHPEPRNSRNLNQMRRLNANQHQTIWHAVVCAFPIALILATIYLATWAFQPQLSPPLVWLIAIVFTVNVLAVANHGYRTMPHQTARFQLTGFEVGGCFITWDQIERTAPENIFRIVAVTLKSGESPSARAGRHRLGRGCQSVHGQRTPPQSLPRVA
jgi:hypothetical protein